MDTYQDGIDKKEENKQLLEKEKLLSNIRYILEHGNVSLTNQHNYLLYRRKNILRNWMLKS